MCTFRAVTCRSKVGKPFADRYLSRSRGRPVRVSTCGVPGRAGQTDRLSWLDKIGPKRTCSAKNEQGVIWSCTHTPCLTLSRSLALSLSLQCKHHTKKNTHTHILQSLSLRVFLSFSVEIMVHTHLRKHTRTQTHMLNLYDDSGNVLMSKLFVFCPKKIAFSVTQKIMFSYVCVFSLNAQVE